MTEEYGHISDGFFLSDEEIDELRKCKKELTEYGKEKFKRLAQEEILKYNSNLKKLSEND